MRRIIFWPPVNYHKIFFLSANFRPKVQHLGLRTPVVEKFKSKIKMSSTHNYWLLSLYLVPPVKNRGEFC